MKADIPPFQEGSADYRADQAEFEGSGQVVTAPEPRGGYPEQGYAKSPRGVGLGGSSPGGVGCGVVCLAEGAASKSRSGGGVGASGSLVFPPNNSARAGTDRNKTPSRSRSENESYSANQNGIDQAAEHEVSACRRKCSDPRLILGECGHGAKRYRLVPCGRRNCEACGAIGRRRIAERIAYGVRQLWPCAWLVLTFPGVDAENPSWKKVAVKRLSGFVRALRNKLGVRLEYAATYELTKRGRLHVNLIIGPWNHIDQPVLCGLWGARVWVEWVKDAGAIGREAAKSYSVEALSGYLAKLEQAVPREWGRRCSFSKRWPKLPVEGLPRLGEITWRYASAEDRIEFYVEQGKFDANKFEMNRLTARLKPMDTDESEWASVGEACMCFVRAGP